MKTKHKSGGRKSAGKTGSGDASRRQGSRATSHVVPAIVGIALVGGLIALVLTRQRPRDLPEEQTPAPDEKVEDIWETDPQLAELRQEAIVILQRVVDRWARDQHEPWMLMHGTLVWGPKHRTLDGEPAGLYMLDHQTAKRTFAGREITIFPVDDPVGSRIDAHVDQTLKTLVEKAIPDPRIDQMVSDAQWRFDYNPDDPENPFPDGNEVPMSAQAFCQTAGEGEDSFTTYEGHVVELATMTEQLVAQLEKESKFLDEIRLAGDTTYDKKRQGIFRYTCGGTHLYMGAAACVAAGFGSPELSGRLSYQMDLLFWRMRREIEVIDDALTQAPHMAPLLVEQRLKYLGHFLETEAKAEMVGLFVPSDFHRRELVYAEQALFLSVKALQEMGVFDRLDAFKDEQYEYYLFTAGDCCHALHALNLQDQLAAQRRGVLYELPDPVYPSEETTPASDSEIPKSP